MVWGGLFPNLYYWEFPLRSSSIAARSILKTAGTWAARSGLLAYSMVWLAGTATQPSCQITVGRLVAFPNYVSMGLEFLSSFFLLSHTLQY